MNRYEHDKILKYSYQRLFTSMLRMTKHTRIDSGNRQMSTELSIGCGFPFWVLTLDCYASGRKLFLEVFLFSVSHCAGTVVYPCHIV
jgi:hypothetical protein